MATNIKKNEGYDSYILKVNDVTIGKMLSFEIAGKEKTMGSKREHCPEMCAFMEEVKEMVGGDQEKVPRFRVPLSSWLGLGAAILGIAGLAAVMLYTWMKVL